MRSSQIFLIAALTTAVAIAACSDSTTGAKKPGPTTQLSGGSGDSTNGSGSGSGSGNGTSGTHGDTTKPDSVKNPPPQPGWPRSVLGVLYGVTYTPGEQDSVRTERVANAKLDLYKAPTPTAPTYDSLPPVFYATTTSNANGEFTFKDLPQAGYLLKVTPPAGSPYKPTAIWFVPQDKNWKMGLNLYR